MCSLTAILYRVVLVKLGIISMLRTGSLHVLTHSNFV